MLQNYYVVESIILGYHNYIQESLGSCCWVINALPARRRQHLQSLYSYFCCGFQVRCDCWTHACAIS